MKASDFIYHRAMDVTDAVQYLQDYGEEARVLAGGQSLVPMLNMRLWRPSALIDINGLNELTNIVPDGDVTRIGALVRHSTIETSPLIKERLPLLVAMAGSIGDRQVRNRGTIGGSLVQGDPTGEFPLGCLVLDAAVTVIGPNGARCIPMDKLYEGAYATSLAPDELLTEIRVPAQPPTFAFMEACRRHNDFATVSVCATGQVTEDGHWRRVRIGLGGVNTTPVLAKDSMALLDGCRLTDNEITAAKKAALVAIDPPSDIRGSAEYRAHLLPIYVGRVLREMRATRQL